MMALTALTIPTKGALSCSTVCFAVLFANSLFESTIFKIQNNLQYNNNNNNNNIYRGSPTRQRGFQWGPHALI